METTRAGDHFVLLEIREDGVEQNQSYLSYKEQAAWRKGRSNEDEQKTIQLGSKSLYQPREAFLIWLQTPRERLYIPAGKPIKTCPVRNNSRARAERGLWTEEERRQHHTAIALFDVD